MSSAEVLQFYSVKFPNGEKRRADALPCSVVGCPNTPTIYNDSDGKQLWISCQSHRDMVERAAKSKLLNRERYDGWQK